MDKLTPETWTTWRNQPTTKLFFKYIRDFRIQTADSFASLVAHGEQVDPDYLNKAVLRCQTLFDLEELNLDDIDQFYEEGEEDGDIEPP